MSAITIGIDATNIRVGGGVTHLIEILRFANIGNNNIAKIIIWGSRKTLDMLPSSPWLCKESPQVLNSGIIQRTLWQKRKLSHELYSNNCNVLLVPGGSYAGRFRPTVTISQNLLPFEMKELKRYRYTKLALRLLMLRYAQSHSFKNSEGLVFLTEYAKKTVLASTGPIAGKINVIPFGINPRFQIEPRSQKPIPRYSQQRPFRILYVSIIDQYKHQWNVVKAMDILRKDNFPIKLDLVGPSYPPALKRLHKVIKTLNVDTNLVHYHGQIAYDSIHKMYSAADLSVFASSCENMPNILLEKMAAGLPIACSNRGPMPEVLGDAGLYFNPESSTEIADVIRTYLLSPELRRNKAYASFARSKQYSWKRCADETFSFLAEVARDYAQLNAAK